MSRKNASFRDAPPTRRIKTEWGHLYAQASHDERVTFTTAHPGGKRHLDGEFVINGVRYDCAIYAHRGELAPHQNRRAYDPEIGEWRFERSKDDGLQRKDDRPFPTRNSMATMRRDIRAALVEWLDSPEGASLLRDGTNYARDGLLHEVRMAEGLLGNALGVVQDAKARILAGGQPTAEQRDLTVTLVELSRSPEWLDLASTPRGGVRASALPQQGGLGL